MKKKWQFIRQYIFFISTQHKFLNSTLSWSHICVLSIFENHIFTYRYSHPKVSILSMDIGIQKCHVCLRILSSEIVLFDYYLEGTIMLLDIHIRKSIILTFFFGSVMILVQPHISIRYSPGYAHPKQKKHIQISYLEVTDFAKTYCTAYQFPQLQLFSSSVNDYSSSLL